MGDLKCGFEEMQGVKLGYLLIKGKQMFALSQVFTDLLQNIPRTTVHKRMDHLNVKKHHCDLEELRKLKAINSIAFHAAKCTLISREDVEALYFSCKTERVLKSNKRKVKGDAREELLHQDTRARSWKEKVWFSLHSVPKTLPLHNKAGSRESPLLPDSNLPQIYNKKHNQEYSSVSESDYKPFKNYETAQITGNCVSYNQRHSFFRTVVNRQPVFLQSAIAQSKLSGAATDLLHKRKRRREEGGCRDSARRSWSRSRHTHQPPVVLVQPKCCSKPKRHSNDSLGAFHLGHDFYLNHGSHHGFQENYSSDTESSTYSERVNNDSDFGSSLSSSSNSGTSDEEQEETQSESSDISTDEEESSSQSDSSSVSSLVSVQSIRFRRPRFTSLPKTKSLNAKTLVLQPTFHYNQQLPPPRTPGEQAGRADSDRVGKQQRHDSANREAKQDTELQQTPKFVSPGQGSLFTETARGGNVTDTHCDPKSAGPVKTSFYLQGLSPSASRSKVFPSCRTPGAAGVSPPGSAAHCSHLNETMSLTSTDRHLSLFMHLKRETQTGSILKLPSPLKSIKTEPEDTLVMGPHSESSRAVKTLPSALQNVKIKVEESSQEYEYSSQACRFQCKGDETDVNNDRYPGSDIKHADYFNYKTKSIESSTGAPRSPSLQECRSTQDPPRPEEGEYTNGARVRKNYRTLVLAEKTGISRTQTKPNVSKVDSKTPCSRPAGKAESSEGNAEELTGASKRKRTFNNVASSFKRSFSFMANFPSPPSLVVGSDGDLSPAFSLNSLRNNRPPPRSHPVWQWQPGGRPVSPPPAPKFRKC